MPVIEITGTTPCSGKTQLLYRIAGQALLPIVQNRMVIGGKEGAVVWLDIDNRFSILRIHSILSSLITENISSQGDDGSDVLPSEVASNALQHLHVFSPQTSASLIETVKALPDHLYNTSGHYSAARPLQVVIISNISAFFWEDRQAKDTDAIEHLDRSLRPGSRSDSNARLGSWRALVSALREVQSIFGCMVVASNMTLASPNLNAWGGISIRSHLPGAWNAFVSMRLVASRERPPKQGPGISAEEALLEAKHRTQTVTDGEFSVCVNAWESERGERYIREGLAELENEGRFRFRVGDGMRIIDSE